MRKTRGRDVSFKRSSLTDANFDLLDFARQTFDRAKCEGATFKEANLSNTIFVNVDFTECAFDGADLRGAYFLDVKGIETCWFGEADLSGAKMPRKITGLDLGISSEMVEKVILI